MENVITLAESTFAEKRTMSINAVEQISLICFELGKLERSKELMHPELSKLFELRAKVCQRHAINKMVAALHDKRQEKRRKQREIRVRQDNYYRALEYISDLQCSSDGLNLFSSQQILTLFNLNVVKYYWASGHGLSS